MRHANVKTTAEVYRNESVVLPAHRKANRAVVINLLGK